MVDIPVLGNFDLGSARFINGLIYDAGSQVFNVKAKAFGALGNGIADDTTAIQNAINAAQAVKGVVLFPPGTYVISSTLVNTAQVTLRGSGFGDATGSFSAATIIKKSADVLALKVMAPFTIVENICFYAALVGDVTDGIWVGDADATNGSGSSVFRNVSVIGMGGVGMWGRNGNGVELDNIRFVGNSSHGLLLDSVNTSVVNVNQWFGTGIQAFSNSGDGVRINQSATNTFNSIDSEGNTGWGIWCNRAYNRIYGGYVENNTAGPMNIGSSCFDYVFIIRSVSGTPTVSNSGGRLYWLDGSGNGPTLTYDGMVTNKMTRVGGFWTAAVAKTANYTVTSLDHTILCDTTGGTFTVTLLGAANAILSGIGKRYVISVVAGAASVTIATTAGQTIDGAATKTVIAGETLEIVGNGSNWNSQRPSSNNILDFIEAAQDAVGGILTDSSTIDFTYNDATPSITASVISSTTRPGNSSVIVSTVAASGKIDSSFLTEVLASTDLSDVSTVVGTGALVFQSYVDAAIEGRDNKPSVRLATTGSLPAHTVSGNQLIASANGALTADSTSVALNDRILVKNESTASQNGIYTVTVVGSAGAQWTLTRATDADSNADVTAGMTTFVSEGTVNGNTGWTLITDDPIVVGTTALTFTQTFGAGAYSGSNINTAGVGIYDSLNGTVLQFRGINNASNKLSVTLNGTTKALDIDATEANFTLNNIGGTLGLAKGGTNANLSATGGTGQVLKQITAGAAITVGTLASTDLTDFTEAVQDVMGAILVDSATIDFTYNDVSNTITTAVIESGLTHNNIGGILGLAKGGTNANLSATGGTGQVLKQVTSGAAITVGTLASTDLTDFTEAAQDAVGTILTDTASVDFTYNDAGNTISAVVLANSTVQKVEVAKAGTLIATRKRINLIQGSNVTLTVTDDSANDKVDVTVTATLTGGSVAKFQQNIGDGTTTTWVVNHGFGQRALSWAIHQAVSPFEAVWPNKVEYTDNNNMTFYFDVAPSAGELDIIIIG
jgi:hypothetical protein